MSIRKCIMTGPATAVAMLCMAAAQETRPAAEAGAGSHLEGVSHGAVSSGSDSELNASAHGETVVVALGVQPPLAEDSLATGCVGDGDCTNLAVCIGGRCFVPKNRYLSIDPNPANAGLTARRVSVSTGGGPVVLGWVGAPQEVQPQGPEDPAQQARMSATPVFLNWNDVGGIGAAETVHLGDCHVSPVHTYLIQSILDGADIGIEGNFSTALELPTVALWGDVVGGLVAPGVAGAPDGFANFVDIFSVFVGFQSVQTAPKVWLELSGAAGANNVPDLRFVNFRDIVRSIGAFAGASYPFDDPCTCAGEAACP